MRKKEKARNNAEIGKEIFSFNYNEEMRIYLYLCGRLRQREYRYLDDTLRFHRYADWEEYVKNRYTKYTPNQLMEFQRYLKGCITWEKENRRIGGGVVSIAFSAVLSSGLSFFVSELINANIEISGWAEMLIWWMLFSLLMISLFFFFFWLTKEGIQVIKDSRNTICLLKDYKEIIDELIKEMMGD